jgi:hypothetical protein
MSFQSLLAYGALDGDQPAASPPVFTDSMLATRPVARG